MTVNIQNKILKLAFNHHVSINLRMDFTFGLPQKASGIHYTNPCTAATCVAANKTTCATSEICFSYTVELTMAAGDSSLEMHVGAHGCASADFEETFTGKLWGIYLFY